MMERKYAPLLNMHYMYNAREGVAVFDDGVRYTVAELMALAKQRLNKPEDAKAIHHVKGIFNGRIMDTCEW